MASYRTCACCDLHPQLILGRDVRLLAAVPQQVEHKLGNISSGDGDMFDRGTNHVAIRDGNSIYQRGNQAMRNSISFSRPPRLTRTGKEKRTSYTVSTVNDDTRKVPLGNFTARPGRCERKHGLNGDIPIRSRMEGKNGDEPSACRMSSVSVVLIFEGD